MNSLRSISDGFRAYLAEVVKLINFDRDVPDLTVQQITLLHKRLGAASLTAPHASQ